MPSNKPVFTTNLEQWRRELAAELRRDVTFEEIASGAGVAYSTVIKHTSHTYRRPDYATAAAICAYFNKLSKTQRTPLEYFEASYEEEEGESEDERVAVMAL